MNALRIVIGRKMIETGGMIEIGAEKTIGIGGRNVIVIGTGIIGIGGRTVIAGIGMGEEKGNPEDTAHGADRDLEVREIRKGMNDKAGVLHHHLLNHFLLVSRSAR